MDIGGGVFIIFFLLFAVVVMGFIAVIWGALILQIVKGVRQRAADNRCPIEQVEARVIAKREHVSGMSNSMTSTYYYGTFEFQTGERKEYPVGGREYGMLAEGDDGVLSFQGSRYTSFQRRPQGSS